MNSTAVSNPIAFISMRLRERLHAGVSALFEPDRWALLSCCDWYPDASGYPSTPIELLQQDGQGSDSP